MNFFSRYCSRAARASSSAPGRERSPDQMDDVEFWRRLHPDDDVGGHHQHWVDRRSWDATDRSAHHYSCGGRRRPWEPDPRRPNHSTGGRSGAGRRPPQCRDTFWDTQRPPPAAEEEEEETVAAAAAAAGNGNSTANATPASDDPAAENYRRGRRGGPRFRDVDIEFNDNNVEDISGGARVVTGFHAGRDFKARINNNTFGRRPN